MKAKLSLIFLLILLVSISVMAQENMQRSENGKAVMDITYLKAKIIQNTGDTSLFSYTLGSNTTTQFMDVCPINYAQDIQNNVGLKNRLKVTPITVLAGQVHGHPPIVDLSTGLCERVPFQLKSNDVFKFGTASTIIEVLNGSATFTVPESKECSYLHCESSIVVQNVGNESILITTLDITAQVENAKKQWLTAKNVPVQETIFNTTNNQTGYITVLEDIDVNQNQTLSIPAGSEQEFILHSDFTQENFDYKYNVSISLDQEYKIDPYFNTTASTLSSGTFSATLLNLSGFVQRNTSSNSILTGTYTSSIFNAGQTADYRNITFSTNSYYGTELPNNAVNNLSDMSSNVLLLHLNSDPAYSENGSIIKDFSGFNNNGFLEAGDPAPVESEGIIDKGLQFTTQHVHFPNNTSLNFNTTSFTVAAWIKTNISVPNDYVIQKRTGNGNGWELGIHNGAANFEVDVGSGGNDVTIQGTKLIANNKWHYVVGVLDRGSNVLRLYVDGRQNVLAESMPAGNTDNGETVCVGGQCDGTDSFQGFIDEVQVFNKALSQDEIWNLYERVGTNLSLSVRTCDDAACSGETFSGNYVDGKNNITSTLNNQYFQYRANFVSVRQNITGRLYNVSIGYDLITPAGNTAPFCVSLNADPNPITQGFITNLSGRCEDDETSVHTVNVEVNGTNYTSINAEIEIFYTLLNTSVLGAGLHNFTFHANDTQGNSSSVYGTFQIISPACVPNWEQIPQNCIGLQSLIVYNDTASCGNTSTIPANNGTFELCTDFSCQYNSDLFFDKKMEWVCIFPQTSQPNIYNCVTRVEHENRFLQSNPKPESIENYGTITTFREQNRLVQVYFTDENLRRNQAYNFSVNCYNNENVTDSLSFKKEVTPKNKIPFVIGDRILFGLDNSAYILATIIAIIFLILGYKILPKFWGKQ